MERHIAGNPREKSLSTIAVFNVDSEENSPLSNMNCMISLLSTTRIIVAGKIAVIESL